MPKIEGRVKYIGALELRKEEYDQLGFADPYPVIPSTWLPLSPGDKSDPLEIRRAQQTIEKADYTPGE